MFGSSRTTGATSTPDTAPTAEASPAQAEHQASTYAEQLRHVGVERGGTHGQPQLGVVEQEVQQTKQQHAHGYDADVLDRNQNAAHVDWSGRKRRWKRVRRVAPDKAGDRIDDLEQRQGHDQDDQRRAALEVPHHQALDGQRADERQRNGNRH